MPDLARTVDCVPDVPFGFALPGGAPDPNDPAQVQRFLGQLQQLFAGAGEGPVNWDLAREIALGSLTGASSPLPGGFGFGAAVPPAEPTESEPPAAPGDPQLRPTDRSEVGEALRLADLWLDPTSA